MPTKAPLHSPTSHSAHSRIPYPANTCVPHILSTRCRPFWSYPLKHPTNTFTPYDCSESPSQPLMLYLVLFGLLTRQGNTLNWNTRDLNWNTELKYLLRARHAYLNRYRQHFTNISLVECTIYKLQICINFQMYWYESIFFTKPLFFRKHLELHILRPLIHWGMWLKLIHHVQNLPEGKELMQTSV